MIDGIAVNAFDRSSFRLWRLAAGNLLETGLLLAA
jgi:hypothetical protein